MKRPTLLFNYDNGETYNTIVDAKDAVDTIRKAMNPNKLSYNEKEQIEDLKEYLKDRNAGYSYFFEITNDVYYVVTNLSIEELQEAINLI